MFRADERARLDTQRKLVQSSQAPSPDAGNTHNRPKIGFSRCMWFKFKRREHQVPIIDHSRDMDGEVEAPGVKGTINPSPVTITNQRVQVEHALEHQLEHILLSMWQWFAAIHELVFMLQTKRVGRLRHMECACYFGMPAKTQFFLAFPRLGPFSGTRVPLS